MAGTKNWIGMVECGLCGAKHRAKVEISKEHDEPIVPLECHECGSMTCSAVYDERQKPRRGYDGGL